MIAVSCAGFICASALSRFKTFGTSNEGPIVSAALLIGVVSNFYARLTGDVAIAPILAGIILLVPGSYGVRSSLGFLTKQTEVGLGVAFDMFIIAICITVGIFIATLIVWPTGTTKKQTLISF